MKIGTHSDSSAFTLTECLVVLATTAFILALPCLAVNGNRERLNRIACINNLRQMGTGSQLYATDDPKGRLSGSLPTAESGYKQAGDDLNWLYGYGNSRTRYIQETTTFVCPTAQNYVRTNLLKLTINSKPYTLILDLYDNANRPGASGQSYEVLSAWTVSGAYVEKTLSSTATHRNSNGPLAGRIPGPSKIALMHDAMESGVDPAALQNYPNPYAGHGSEGGNMLFSDGHAEWVSEANWSRVWSVSTDTSLSQP